MRAKSIAAVRSCRAASTTQRSSGPRDDGAARAHRRLVVVERAGHALLPEQPVAVVEAMEQQLVQLIMQLPVFDQVQTLQTSFAQKLTPTEH